MLVYIEVVGSYHEGEALVVPLGYLTLHAFHLRASPVETYVSVFVLHQVVSVVAVYKFLLE